MKLNKIHYMKMLMLISAFSLLTTGCCTFSGSSYNGEVSDHFDGKQFFNQSDVQMKDEVDMLTWVATRERGLWPTKIVSEQGPPPLNRVGMGELRITFVNHSTVLIQMDSLNILTDPVWSYRVSPVGFVGPTRKRDPGLKFEDLPSIDYVLVSHNHYDHMDMPTLKRLKESHNPQFIVSLGNKEYMIEEGMVKTYEMDWWDEMTIGSETYLTFVPAQHFAMRGLCDRNTTLWGGFVMESEEGPVYFAGDTGFGIEFEEIYDKFGPMRFSMIPIGAFIPREFVAPVHTSPEEAVKIHQIIKSQLSMGIHWGTFQQADDGYLDPVNALIEARKKLGVSKREFALFKHGVGYNIPKLELEPNEEFNAEATR